jgi:drug/metabolite transporter (DMT)-like permease
VGFLSDLSPEGWATVFILMSAILHAFSSTMFKADGDRLMRSAFTGMISGIVALPMIILFPFPAPEVWPWLLTASFFQVIFILATLKALEHGDLSFTYPITRGTGPVCVILVLAFIFGTNFDPYVLIGIAIVVLGIFELARSGYKHAENKEALKKAFVFSLIGGGCIGVFTIMDANGIKLVSSSWSYIGWLFVLFAINTNLLAWVRRRKVYAQQLKLEFKRGILAGVLGSSSYALALLAFRSGSTAEIAALRETSIVFVLLIGYFFLKEEIGPRRVTAVVLISIGAIVIKAF